MSGGSYDYFFSRAPEALQRIASDLSGMSERCTDPEAWGRDEVDVNDLAAVGAHLGALALKIEGLAIALSKLEQVTKDVEWWQSGDTGPDRVVESFKKATQRQSAGEDR
jgi:hypothetical protein